MNSLTPESVFSLFRALNDQGQLGFLRLLGRFITAEAAFAIAAELPATETARYAQMVFESSGDVIYPRLIREARRLAQETANLSDDEFNTALIQRMRMGQEEHERELSELIGADLKQDRDRKSDPEIVRRNVRICDLRRQDPKTWSLGKLAQHFDRDKRTIADILKEEAKWRRLASEGGGTTSATP